MVKPLLYFQNYFNKKNFKLVYLHQRLKEKQVSLMWLVSELAGKHGVLVVIIHHPYLQARKMLSQRPQKGFQPKPLQRIVVSQRQAGLALRRELLYARCCGCLRRDLRSDSFGDGATADKPPRAKLRFKGDRNVNSGSTPGSGLFALATQKSGRKNQVLT